MGKAKRAKLKRIEEEKRAEKLREQKRAERRDTMKVTMIAVSILLVIAIIVGACCLVVTAIRSTGNYLRDKVSITSKNYEVDNAMMSYFFRSTVNNYISQYYYYLSYIGLNTSTALRDQSYSDTMSWYDFFMQQAAGSVADLVVFNEAARAEGVELTDADRARIDKEMENLAKSAEEAKVSTEKFIHDNFGLGVKESDIRAALELNYLYQKFYYQVMNGIEVTEKEIKEYYEKNSADYLMVDYKVYTFKVVDGDKKGAAEKAEKLAEATDEKSFDITLRRLIADDYKDKDDVLDKQIKNTLVEGEVAKKDSEYSKWLFDEKREVGDTKVITDDKGNATVYMLVEKQHLDESETKNVRHILFALDDYATDAECKAAAEALLAQFKADGGDEKKFAELAEKHSSDMGSAFNGGLYEDVPKGRMVEEFENWLFDDSRKVGDCEIVKTDYGYHIMYFVGEGRTVWESGIYNKLLSDKFSDIAKDYSKEYKVEVDYSKLSNIPDIH